PSAAAGLPPAAVPTPPAAHRGRRWSAACRGRSAGPRGATCWSTRAAVAPAPTPAATPVPPLAAPAVRLRAPPPPPRAGVPSSFAPCAPPPADRPAVCRDRSASPERRVRDAWVPPIVDGWTDRGNVRPGVWFGFGRQEPHVRAIITPGFARGGWLA